MSNAAHPSKNTHHTGTYHSEQEWYTDNFGKGEADPDRVGHYPGQVDE